MHPCVVTYPVGRGAARLPHTATPCWTRLACQQRLPLSNQAAQFTVRAYAPDRNASVSTKQAAAGVSHELRDILAPTCTIAHVKRQSPSYKPELSQIVHRLPSFKSKVTCTDANVLEATGHMLRCLPSSPVTEALRLDIQTLVCQFLKESGYEAVDAALSVVTATSCPRFHADHVELRCLCTYIGEGTYYVPNAAVDRRKWMRALGFQDTNGFGVKSDRAIQQAQEWDVVVLKGNAFPGNEGAGAVHKSPSASASSPRLLLTLDKGLQPCCPDCPSELSGTAAGYLR